MFGSKGQSANELLVIYMFVMLIFTIFVLSFAQDRSAEIQASKVRLADSIGDRFAYELNLAATSGNGYSRKMNYPLTLDGITPYTIILNNISRTIDINFTVGATNYTHSFPVINTNVLVTPNIPAILPNGTPYGYVLHSTNLQFSRGDMYIQNIDGEILISTITHFVSTPWGMNIAATPTEINPYGNTSTVSVFVYDQFFNPIPDGTLVHFQTTLGTIDEFAPTVNGTANATLISGFDVGPATVNATISVGGGQLSRSIRVSIVGI